MTTAILGTAIDPGAAGRRPRWSPSFWIGSLVVTLIVLAALVSFVRTPADPLAVDAAHRLAGPSRAHLLGTDSLGRDVASRMLVGSRTTLFVGVIAVGVAAVLGTPLGVLAGMGGRAVSEVVLRFVDLVLAFPALLLAIVFGAVWGPSTLTAMLAIGIATAPAFARLARAGTLQVMASEYVLAARVAGRPRADIAVRHVLPNVAGLLIVQASVSFGVAVLAESGLSYLGYGTPPPTPSWGRVLQEAQTVIATDPLLSVWPALAIAVAVLGFNCLGDGLRDRFDPRLAQR